MMMKNILEGRIKCRTTTGGKRLLVGWFDGKVHYE